MTTTQDLIAQLRDRGGFPVIHEAADTLEALQVENERLETLAKGQHVELYNARLRLAEIEKQEPLAYLWKNCDGRYSTISETQKGAINVIAVYASAGASLVATPIVAWAKSTPRKLRITTMDMGREDGWRPLGYTAAGASPVEPSQSLSLDLLERLNKTLTRLGYATPEGGMEHFNADLANQLYNLCRAVDSLFDREQPPAPGEAAREFMAGYSDGIAWAQLSQAQGFNNAINFAIEQGMGCSDFLRAWREGDTSEWPEFVATPILQQHNLPSKGDDE